ncbi:hypothetical protein DM02DRAFT_523434, partial [Periconia macrospinosa]
MSTPQAAHRSAPAPALAPAISAAPPKTTTPPTPTPSPPLPPTPYSSAKPSTPTPTPTPSHFLSSLHSSTPLPAVSSSTPAPNPSSTTATRTPPTAPSVTSSTSTSPRPDRSINPSSSTLESSRKLARNVSPGLLARMKFLNQGQETSPRVPTPVSQIGRISEHKIRELDEFHRDRSVRIERRGTTWGGSIAGSISGSVTASQASTPLIPQLTGESVPALAMDQSPPPGFESDRSSLVSTSDKVLPSDSEAGENLSEDTQKYRLPDITKTKSLTQSI